MAEIPVRSIFGILYDIDTWHADLNNFSHSHFFLFKLFKVQYVKKKKKKQKTPIHFNTNHR